MIFPIIFIIVIYVSIQVPTSDIKKLPFWGYPIEFPGRVLDLLLQKLDVSFSPRKHDLSAPFPELEMGWAHAGCSSQKKVQYYKIHENIRGAKAKTWHIGLIVIHQWESFQRMYKSQVVDSWPSPYGSDGPTIWDAPSSLRAFAASKTPLSVVWQVTTAHLWWGMPKDGMHHLRSQISWEYHGKFNVI